MDLLGTDFAAMNGDIALNAQGDIATASGTDNLTSALIRRFETPIGALFYEQTYGNPLFYRLSLPMGQTFEKDAVSDVTACILGDSRVQSANVQVTVNREQRRAIFDVSYVAKDGSTGSFSKGVSQLV